MHTYGNSKEILDEKYKNIELFLEYEKRTLMNANLHLMKLYKFHSVIPFL